VGPLHEFSLQFLVDRADAGQDAVGLGRAAPAVEPPPDLAGLALGAGPEQLARWGGKDTGAAGAEQLASLQVAAAAPTFGKSDRDAQHYG
jgi:hypothetical protein